MSVQGTCKICGFETIDYLCPYCLYEEVERLRTAYSKQDREVCQTLGKVLGYPWYKDDQENFPGATEADGVCVGEHIAETLAMEAARRIVEANKEASQAQLELSRRRCNDSSRDGTWLNF